MEGYVCDKPNEGWEEDDEFAVRLRYRWVDRDFAVLGCIEKTF